MNNQDKWSQKLSDERYKVLRQKATEPAFSGKLLNNKQQGTYMCGACEQDLFTSDTKFDSGSGWPSFYDALPGAVTMLPDNSQGMKRVEAVCSHCGSHLGHVFDDALDQPTGQRFCINSLSLKFKK